MQIVKILPQQLKYTPCNIINNLRERITSQKYVTGIINNSHGNHLSSVIWYVSRSSCTYSILKLYKSLNDKDKEFFPDLLYNFKDEQDYNIEGRQVRAFNKLYNKSSNQYDAKQLLDLFKKCTFLDKFRKKNFNFLYENIHDKHINTYMEFCEKKPPLDLINQARKLIKLGISDKYLADFVYRYRGSILKEVEYLKKKGWNDEEIYKLCNYDITESKTESLKTIIDTAIQKKEIIQYEDDDYDDSDIKDLFMNNIGETLTLLELIGKKDFIHLFNDKIDLIEEYLEVCGELNIIPKNYQSLLKLTNPVESNEYKERCNAITAAKNKLKENPVNKEEIIKEINDLTSQNRVLINNSIKEPHDKINIIYACYSFSDNEKKLEKLLTILHNGNDVEQLRIYLQKELHDHFGFKHNKVLKNLGLNKLFMLCRCGEDCSNSLKEIATTLNRHPNDTVLNALNSLLQNQQTRRQFYNNKLNYKRWTTFNPKSYIEKDVIIDNSKIKYNVLKNFETDFNDFLKDKNERNYINNILKKGGYEIKSVKLPEYDNCGTLTGYNDRLKLYKNNEQIEFDDILKIIKLLKDELLTNNKNDESLKEFKHHILTLRYNEAKKIPPKNQQYKTTIKVRKADMNNIAHSLFLGNHASCCTAIGTGCNEWTAPEYIKNKLISCIEVLDGDKSVGNTMCYCAKIDGKSALILDNIELKRLYQYNDVIRDMIFEYAKKLTIELGKPKMPIYAGPNRHKVDMSAFPIEKKEFKIIGSTDKSDIYLDFDTNEHQISGKEKFCEHLYRLN